MTRDPYPESQAGQEITRFREREDGLTAVELYEALSSLKEKTPSIPMDFWTVTKRSIPLQSKKQCVEMSAICCGV